MPRESRPVTSVDVHCAVCLNLGSERRVAVTVANTYAVCADHAETVMAKGFSIHQLKGGGGGRKANV